MREPLEFKDALAQIQQIPADTVTRPRTWYEQVGDYQDTVLGVDFEDKLFIYLTLLLFTWICNTGIVYQLQFKKEVQIAKLVLYSVLIPIALFMILIPILMYFEIWANYRALVAAVIASNFFTYFLTKNAVMKKERLVKFSTKVNNAKQELIKLIDTKTSDQEQSEQIKELRNELDEFGPKYYNGV